MMILMLMKNQRVQTLLMYGVMAAYVAFALHLGTMYSTIATAFSATSLPR